MGFVTLYTYNPLVGVLRSVFRSDTDPTYISYSDTSGGGSASQPPAGTIVSVICAPGTFDRYTYKVKATIPYADFDIFHNSDYCGYVPPTCDIYIKSFTKSDETAPGANDGTANLFCVSSFGPITYKLKLSDGTLITTNTTGYFTGIAPGNYFIQSLDTNNCGLNQYFTILPYTSTDTHYKYKLAFGSIDGRVNWELRFLDMKNKYDSTQYPKLIKGTDQPLLKKTADPNEDKTTVICSTQLTINLVYDGTNFTPDEFASVPEQSWKIELYKDGVLDFQGWLIPDGVQDFYADPLYIIQVTATDGLPSLKGNIWGNGSGGQGYSNFQIQQYGLATWASLVKQCLDQLGYDYGKAILVSSLQFNNTYNSSLWANIATWSDILYDSSGNAVDTYTALTNLLGAFKLAIFQHTGRFFMVNWNDVFYMENALKTSDFLNAFYEFSSDFTSIDATGLAVQQPTLQILGFNFPNKPINPMQTKNMDQAYNIEVDISYNVLALLYENPSFAIGAVQGALPTNFRSQGTMNAFVNYDPVVDGVIGSGAYTGDWELKVKGSGTLVTDSFIENDHPFFQIDQVNRLVNVSFQWKVPQCTATLNGGAIGYIPSFTVVYIDSVTHKGYFLNTPQTADGEYIGGLFPVVSDPPSGNTWTSLGPSSTYSEGDAASIKPEPVTDYIGWQSFSITSPLLPDSQIGTISVRIYGVKKQLYDKSKYGAPVGYNVSKLFIGVDTSDPGYYLVDDLNITLSDGSPTSTLQIGETHIETAVTGIPVANLKTVNQSLFTYPNNKRVAGNVFSINDYTTGQVANLWNFKLHTNDKQDRLPATVSKAIARNYSRQMVIFEGDIEANYMQFYGLFQIENLTGKLFMPFSVELDCRNNVCHVILVEIDDTDAQFIYTYTAIYQNNARQISAGN